jgi:hypothetical protein
MRRQGSGRPSGPRNLVEKQAWPTAKASIHSVSGSKIPDTDPSTPPCTIQKICDMMDKVGAAHEHSGDYKLPQVTIQPSSAVRVVKARQYGLRPATKKAVRRTI